jgi:hypothetical protein
VTLRGFLRYRAFYPALVVTRRSAGGRATEGHYVDVPNIYACYVCGRLGIPPWVVPRTWVWGWTDDAGRGVTPCEDGEDRSVTCMPCANRISALRKQETTIHECRKLIWQIRNHHARKD